MAHLESAFAMKIHDVKQNSSEWLELRCSLPTASEFHNLISPTGEIRRGDGPKTYLATKLAEKWGGPLPGFSSWAAECGHILEAEVLPWAAFEFGWDLKRIGFITTDDGRAGCSPDALFASRECGLEIKSPESHTQISYLLGKRVPKIYEAQIQGSMFVTGFKNWKFVSYRRHLPPLILDAEPKEEFQKNLAEALFIFCNDFDQAWEYLLEQNGGPPPKRVPMTFADDIRRGANYADLNEVIP